ncbi:MAG: NADH-quinone oxidoreductase subunit N [Phycisphaeraceae bacterium]|nr:NADH-quinone oxidoreductase subunit N [Phycisphaeraceae bacterium]
MSEKLALLVPEIIVFLTTCIVMVVGLSPNLAVRRSCGLLSASGLFIAAILAINGPAGDGLLPGLTPYIKAVIALIGVLLVMLVAGTVDREEDARVSRGGVFNALRTNRAEFYSFILFSLTGAMLCASASDLIWLFLALELTSLPTYVLVTMSTRGTRSQEAGVKYFFLGALGAAVFLYGFALIYGGTGSTKFVDIASIIAQQGINQITLAGMILAIIGVSFKIAAVPMHFYTADVYQGAASPVTAFLAFVPKTAGFVSLILLLALVGWDHGTDKVSVGHTLPSQLRLLLWVMAALTMTIGNVLAVVQSSPKRVLAYSSIAHSGYMLVGLIAGPGDYGAGFAHNGIAAVLFYLAAYGLMNVGAFAALAGLERRGRDGRPVEIDSFDDLRGLCAGRPLLGWTLVVCSLSLLGLPPLLGFFSKLPLFTSGIASGEIVLVIVMGINSAIAAFYYLRFAAVAMLEDPSDGPKPLAAPFPARAMSGLVALVLVISLSFFGDALMKASRNAAVVEGSGVRAVPASPSPGHKAGDRHDAASPAAAPAQRVGA